jgi:thiol:disulfide interchange protein
MEEIVIKRDVYGKIRKIIGVILILAGSAWLVSRLGELRLFDILYFVVFVIMGLSQLTNSFGQEKTWVKVIGNQLHIKWFNKFRPVIAEAGDIKSVTLTRFDVKIERRQSKPVKLSLDHYEREQKKEIYEFFINYTSKNEIELIRGFEQ